MKRTLIIALFALVLLTAAYIIIDPWKRLVQLNSLTSRGRDALTQQDSNPNPPMPIIEASTAEAQAPAPTSFSTHVFSNETPGARDIIFSPGGTMLVSMTAKRKVVALPDRDNDGKADQTVTVLAELEKPHGLAFYNNKLFVATETEVLRYNWDEQRLTAQLDKKILTAGNNPLPGSNGGHFSRSLVFDSAGKLYISIGSTCNVCIEKHPWLTTVVVTDQDGNNPRVFAKGLRNAVFLTMKPNTNDIWVTEMGRDFLGDNTPPDEINILQENGDYGWPYCYGNKVYDSNFGQESASYCQKTIAPVFEIQAHSAPLGLSFVTGSQFPQDWQGDLLVAYHGSWNRSEPTGYKVVKLNVEGNRVTGQQDFLTGFTKGENVLGRPVDVAFNSTGTLFVSDDKAGVIYRVQRD